MISFGVKMIHWFVFNFLVMLVTGLFLVEEYFKWDIGFLPALALILFFITLLIFIKDVYTLKGH